MNKLSCLGIQLPITFKVLVIEVTILDKPVILRVITTLTEVGGHYYVSAPGSGFQALLESSLRNLSAIPASIRDQMVQ